MGTVKNPLVLNVKHSRLLVPKMSSKNPVNDKVIARTTIINITFNRLTTSGVRQLIVAVQRTGISCCRISYEFMMNILPLDE